MATFRVTGTLEPVVAFVGAIRRRTRATPRVRSLSTGDTVAVVQHRGGRQSVVSQRQRQAIRGKVGSGVPVPAVGAVMIHPRRPVRATPKMARQVVLDDAKRIITGSSRGAEPIMRADVLRQFGAGGDPSWPQSRDWGRYRARRPTLGGAGGRVAAAWRAANYREAR